MNNLKYILFFGLPSWILIDLTWSMLSQISNHVPESYSISVYLIFSLTIGNIIPLILNNILKKTTKVFLNILIFIILSIGLLSGIGLAIVWNKPITIRNHQYSILFCILFFIVGACSSSSNVTHYIFISKFTSKETTFLSTGMAIGSLIAGILGVTQGLFLSNYGLNVSYTYLIGTFFYILAIISFFKLSNIPDDCNETTDSFHSTTLLLDEKNELNLNPSDSYSSSSFKVNINSVKYSTFSSFYQDYSNLVRIQLFNTLLGYGLVPSLISPICSLFHQPQLIILLSTSIFCILDPIFRSSTIFYSFKKPFQIIYASYILYILAFLLLLPLFLPNNSSIFSSSLGGFYVMFIYICFGCLFGYINTSLFLYFKHTIPVENIEPAYRYTGIVSQTGALIGSFLSFVLVVSGLIY